MAGQKTKQRVRRPLLFGGVLDLARKKQPSCGVLSEVFLAVADIAPGVRQLIGRLLTALA